MIYILRYFLMSEEEWLAVSGLRTLEIGGEKTEREDILSY